MAAGVKGAAKTAASRATSDRDHIAKALATISGANDKSDLVREIEQPLVS